MAGKKKRGHISRKHSKTRFRSESQPGNGLRIAAAPRRRRSRKGVLPRLTLHKTRSAWFQARATWPFGEADIDNLVSERAKHPPQKPVAGTAQWMQVGPTNIGGRATALACDPRDERRLWLGAAGGGVWFTPDGGQTWIAQWHGEEVLNIGSLAVDPRRPDTLFCGTGEADLSADSYPGVGLFRTVDGGHSWNRIARSRDGTVPSRIGTIAIDPFDSNHVMLGGVGYENRSPAPDAHGGLYSSNDAGGTWRRDNQIVAGNYWCHSIVFNPTQRGVVLAAITANGMASGVYRSSNGGMTWNHVTTGWPTPDRVGRTALAVSPTDPKRLYAIAADYASDEDLHDKVLGVFRSDDGGTTWQNVAGRFFLREGQMSYGCTIVVHPTDPNVVVCGGVDLHRTNDGGRTWVQISAWDAKRSTSGYAHADHHALLMPASRPGLIYDANDGGLDMSADSGANWTNRSNGLATTMFYDFDVAQNDVSVFGGGAQDNGTLVTQNGAADQYGQILTGDGGWIVFDPADANHLFASYYQFHIYLFKNGGVRNVSPPCPDDERNAVWMAYITLDPNDATAVLTGSTRVWRTTNDGASWKPVSKVLDGSVITAIEIAPSDSNRFFVGTTDGGVFRSTDAGATWSANIRGGIVPGKIVTRIDAHPTDAQQLFLCVGGTGSSHVFYSRDAGASWQDIDEGRLPDVPHNAVLVRPDNTNEIYVANDAGVYVTTDLGRNWRNISDTLPTSQYVDLIYRRVDRRLFTASYGRSTWARVLV